MKKTWIIVGAAVVLAGIVLGVALKVKMSSTHAGLSASESPRPHGSFEAMMQSAGVLRDKGELLQAQEAYKDILAVYGAHPKIEDVQKTLEDVNMKILVSAINVPGKTATHIVKPGETLTALARQYATTIEFIKKQNGLSSAVIRPGMHLRIWTGKFSVLVDKSQNILTLSSDADIVRTYRVSTGRGNITPVGTFKIVNKLMNPDWTHEGKVIPFGNPENILGTRWMGFDVPGYGLHGTAEPEKIGQQVTAGCVRMLNNEVEELFDLLPVGTEVTIVD